MRGGIIGVVALACVVSTTACAGLLGFDDAKDMEGDGGGSGPEASIVVPGETSETGASTADGSSSSKDGGASSKDSAPESSIVTPTGGCAASCVTAAPDGWSGPYVAKLGNGSEPPACDGDFATTSYVGHDSPSADPMSCACSCGSPSAPCGQPTPSFYSDSSCSNACTIDLSLTLLCIPLLQGCSKYAKFEPGAPGAGSCTPSVTKSKPPVAWGSSVRLCGAMDTTKADCEDGKVCQPSAQTQVRCVSHPGQLACPAGFPVAHEFYEGVTDTRSCNSCSCGAASGMTCEEVGVRAYSDLLCSTAPTTTTSTGSCEPLGSKKMLSYIPGNATGGSCAPSGGEPTGAVAPATPTTVCCSE